MQKIKQLIQKFIDLYHPDNWSAKGIAWKVGVVLFSLILISGVLVTYWGQEPDTFSVQSATQEYLPQDEQGEKIKSVVGSNVVGTTAKTINILLNKSGGYLRNDIFPLTVAMDNIPSWEYGVLKHLREVSLVLRNEYSRSQSQSTQVKELGEAENKLRYDSTKWMLPSSEKAYETALEDIIKYGDMIADPNQHSAQFYARADNLVAYLELVTKSLGDVTQHLSASQGDLTIDADVLNNDVSQSTYSSATKIKETPYMQIDNVFFESRGYCWAVLHQLKAIRLDFHDILANKNALASLDQIINVFEYTQQTVYSPVILNGGGFGFFANHSLVMAAFVSRANAGIIDLIQLLKNG